MLGHPICILTTSVKQEVMGRRYWKGGTGDEVLKRADIEDELVHHINQSSGKSSRPCYLLVLTLNLPL